jgi:cytoskeletal protein CcmA (bactofilin family)
MAIFSSSTPAREGGAPEPQRRRGEPTAVSIIGKDMTITGDLETEGVIKVEGAVRGTIRAATQVLVSPGATIDGDLHTREAVVGGTVRGTIHAEERVEVQATAVIAGDIHTTRILVVEGGQVNGEIKMGEAAERRMAAPAKSDEQLPAWSES